MKFEIYVGIAVGSATAIGFRQVDMASALLAGVLLFELVVMGAERWHNGRETRAYCAKIRMLRKAWADAAVPSTRREGASRASVESSYYPPPPRWAPPAQPPRNVRIVHAPSGAVEVLGKGDR